MTQTDENTKTKSERLSLQIAFHTKPKIKNQPTPKKELLALDGETVSSLETAYSG